MVINAYNLTLHVSLSESSYNTAYKSHKNPNKLKKVENMQNFKYACGKKKQKEKKLANSNQCKLSRSPFAHDQMMF